MTCNIWQPLAITLLQRADEQSCITEISWRDPCEDLGAQARPIGYASFQPVHNPAWKDVKRVAVFMHHTQHSSFKVMHALLHARDGKTQLLCKPAMDTTLCSSLSLALYPAEPFRPCTTIYGTTA